LNGFTLGCQPGRVSALYTSLLPCLFVVRILPSQMPDAGLDALMPYVESRDPDGIYEARIEVEWVDWDNEIFA
jgi:hypothetical protein